MHIEQFDGVTLYCADSRELLPTLGKVDAVITDPPYGIGFKHSGRPSYIGKNKHRAHSRNDTIHGDDVPFDPAPFLLADSLLFFGADHFRARLPDGGRFLAWDKTGHGKTPATSFSDVEFMWTSKGSPQNIFHYMWKGILQDGEKGERRYHVSQKPIALMHWAIRQAKVPPGGLILDPFMGSGSTGVAAVQTGHPFTGIEYEQRFFAIACRRIEEAARQGLLLPPVAHRPPSDQQDAFSHA